TLRQKEVDDIGVYCQKQNLTESYKEIAKSLPINVDMYEMVGRDCWPSFTITIKSVVSETHYRTIRVNKGTWFSSNSTKSIADSTIRQLETSITIIMMFMGSFIEVCYLGLMVLPIDRLNELQPTLLSSGQDDDTYPNNGQRWDSSDIIQEALQ
uniref:Uncharacterized protein n=1 Tax=Romanomermis culicivorax TaxID=13658 RepID=A0A915HUD2_ROMCU